MHLLTILLQAPATSVELGPFSQFLNYGLPGLCILALGFLSYTFIKQMQAKQTKLEDFVMGELKDMNEKMIGVVENNTNALKEIREEQQDLRNSIDKLNERIGALKN